MDEFFGTGRPLSAGGFDEALAQLDGLAPETLWSVLSVETSGCGYLPDRRPKILFERYHFHSLTGGRYDAANPDISARSAGGYGADGAHQYSRLAAALRLDRRAALKSASWGLGQTLGEYCSLAGFADVEDMVAAYVGDEDAQILGMAKFVCGKGVRDALHAQDWAAFASAYNGPNYAVNDYDTKLATAHAHYVEKGLPDLRLRAAQVYLSYLGYDTGGIDGVQGPKTKAATLAFQKGHDLTADGQVNDAMLTLLVSAGT